MPKKIKRIVFSGGGAKGVVYPGAYRAMFDAGMNSHIEEYAGSSAGSISAALAAVGMTPQDFRHALLNTNLQKLMGKRSKKYPYSYDGEPLEAFIRSHLLTTVRDFLQKESLVHHPEIEIQNLIRKFLFHEKPVLTFGDLKLLNQHFPNHFKKLTVPAVQFSDGKLKIFSINTTPDVEIAKACRASASIPIVLSPTEINGIKYIDGGFFDNLPTEYFDYDPKTGLHQANTIPEQTLVYGFGEGLLDEKNTVFQALYGAPNNKAIYKPSTLERLQRDYLPRWLIGLCTSYKNTDQKNLGFQKLRDKYPLRTVEMRVGNLSTRSFSRAQKYARVMDAMGYLDAMNHITNHNLHDSSVFNEQKFYAKLIKNYTIIKQALSPHQDPKPAPAYQPNRAYYYELKKITEHHPNSSEAFALSRALELYHKDIKIEELQQEILVKSQNRFKNAFNFFKKQKNNLPEQIQETLKKINLE